MIAAIATPIATIPQVAIRRTSSRSSSGRRVAGREHVRLAMLTPLLASSGASLGG